MKDKGLGRRDFIQIVAGVAAAVAAGFSSTPVSAKESSALRPEFTKHAGSNFRGDDAAYNKAIWSVAESAGPSRSDRLGGRGLAACGIDDRDVTTAHTYLVANNFKFS